MNSRLASHPDEATSVGRVVLLSKRNAHPDDELLAGIRDRESILLLKGPRQSGKTSLIGRGTRFAKQLGCRF